MGTVESQEVADYRRVAAAIEYIDRNADAQPSLGAIAGAVGLSPHHFHRLFRRWAGTTPKRFLQLLTLEDAKQRLRASRTVLHTAFDVGLSGPSRLHDLFVTLEGVTPGEFADGGQGLEISYGVAPTPFGLAFVAQTSRGVCSLAFVDSDEGDRSDSAEPGTIERPDTAATVDTVVAELAGQWPEANLVRNDDAARALVSRIFRGDRPALHVRGTNFQVKVWQALLEIPEGQVAAYGDLASALGRPGSARAVAGAVARNRVAWLIPCHRVIRKVGRAGGYRWGTNRKRAMLAWESARSENAAGRES